jgi:uncharacterized protein YbcI
MAETPPSMRARNAMADVSSAMVKLHKEQFGRGPTHARTDFAGRDTLVCTLENALLPGERAMVEVGEVQKVRESRTFLQAATAALFTGAVEEILDRRVRAFASAIDPEAGVVYEVFTFHSEPDGRGDGAAQVAGDDGRLS